MYSVNEKDFNYRHIDHGPKYLMKGPNLNFGIVQLQPGNVVSLHYHEIMEEDFFVLEGNVSFTVDETIYSYQAGDFIHLEPGEAHCIENTGTTITRFIVVTNPWMDHADKIAIDKNIVRCR
jgi:quercetin dioxygenase-like cupin family protein